MKNFPGPVGAIWNRFVPFWLMTGATNGCQLIGGVRLSVASNSTTPRDAGQLTTIFVPAVAMVSEDKHGGELSGSTVIMNWQVTLLNSASMASQETTFVPSGKNEPLGGVQPMLMIPPQPAVAVGVA